MSSGSRKPTSAATAKSAWLKDTSNPTSSSTKTYGAGAGAGSNSGVAPKSTWNAAKTTTFGSSASATVGGVAPSTKSTWNTLAPNSASASGNKYAVNSTATKSAAPSALSSWSMPSKSNALVAKSTALASTSSSYPTKYTPQPSTALAATASRTKATSQYTSSSASSTQLKSSTYSATSTTVSKSTQSSSSSSSSSAYKSSSQQHFQQHASSINKNVLDKAANLTHYKSPDLLAMRNAVGGGRNAVVGSLVGSKYYTPVYSRATGEPSSMAGVGGGIGGGLLRVGPAAGLAAAVLHHHTNNSNEMVGNKPQLLTAAPNKTTVTTTPLTGALGSAQPQRTSVVNSANVAMSKPTIASSSDQQQQPKQTAGKFITRLGTKSGYLVIFNQQEFRVPGVQSRAGSQMDEEALCRTFYDFGFDPHVKRNLKLKELDKVARELNKKDFKKYACCVVVVLSHGHQNETIYAADGPFNLQTMLVDRLTMNESLQGKAKIFIVAACKGDAEVGKQARLQTDARPFVEPVAKSLPHMRDTLKCYSTYEGFVSYRDPERGTVFVQELCRLLRKHGHSMHVEDVLKLVNAELTERPTHQQVPSVMSTMSFNICLGDLKH